MGALGVLCRCSRRTLLENPTSENPTIVPCYSTLLESTLCAGEVWLGCRDGSIAVRDARTAKAVAGTTEYPREQRTRRVPSV